MLWEFYQKKHIQKIVLRGFWGVLQTTFEDSPCARNKKNQGKVMKGMKVVKTDRVHGANVRKKWKL